MDIRKGDIVILEDGMTVRVVDVGYGFITDNEDNAIGPVDSLITYTETLQSGEGDLNLKVTDSSLIVWNETAISRS